MTDQIDQASKIEQLTSQTAIETARRNANKRDAEPVGVCLYCGDGVEGDRRWCDAECRDCWERITDKARRRNA